MSGVSLAAIASAGYLHNHWLALLGVLVSAASATLLVLLAIAELIDLRRLTGRWTWQVPQPPAFANPIHDDPADRNHPDP